MKPAADIVRKSACITIVLCTCRRAVRSFTTEETADFPPLSTSHRSLMKQRNITAANIVLAAIAVDSKLSQSLEVKRAHEAANNHVDQRKKWKCGTTFLLGTRWEYNYCTLCFIEQKKGEKDGSCKQQQIHNLRLVLALCSELSIVDHVDKIQ